MLSLSTTAAKGLRPVPGGLSFVPMPGLFVAPKAPGLEDPNPPALLPKRPPEAGVLVVFVAPKAAGLLAPPPNRDDPPPKGEDVDAEPKPEPPPNDVFGAVAVVEPNRPPPLLVVAAPNAGFAPKPEFCAPNAEPEPDAAPKPPPEFPKMPPP